MKVHLITNTPEPLKAIAIPFLNMGIGRDIRSFKDISQDEAQDALKEIFKSHLDAPLEFASFNFFLEDIPLFLRAQLVRHRSGFVYAERSLRFYDANLNNPVDDYDFTLGMPTVTDRELKNPIFGGNNIKSVVEAEMKRQMFLYSKMLEENVDQQDARNVIGVWFPTDMQIACNYRALRTALADRLSSQAHPLWQFVAHEIKMLVSEVSPELGAGLIDSCELYGKCVWGSRFDRDCDGCIKRGLKKPHEHIWSRDTSFGQKTQCDCGILKPFGLLEDKSSDNGSAIS